VLDQAAHICRLLVEHRRPLGCLAAGRRPLLQLLLLLQRIQHCAHICRRMLDRLQRSTASRSLVLHCCFAAQAAEQLCGSAIPVPVGQRSTHLRC
jgi:hypothetical protein